jgi:hypothetical protein
MSKLIIKSIEDIVDQYINLLTIDYKLNKIELKKKWDNLSGNDKKIETVPQQPKKTGYQIFFALKRNELKTNNPKWTHNEITKEISNLWNKLTPIEKNKYSSEMLPQIQKFTFEELNEKKMSELKEICEKYGIKKGGNKTELIKNLLGQNNENIEQSKTKLVNSIKTPTNDLDLYINTEENEEKRVDFQTEEVEQESDYDSESDNDSKESDVSSESSLSLNEEDFEP